MAIQKRSVNTIIIPERIQRNVESIENFSKNIVIKPYSEMKTTQYPVINVDKINTSKINNNSSRLIHIAD